MRKFHRIEHRGVPRHVIDEGRDWRLLEGDLFGRYRPSDRLRHVGDDAASGRRYRDGTPAGIGPLAAGDRVTIKAAGFGELTNPVR